MSKRSLTGPTVRSAYIIAVLVGIASPFHLLSIDPVWQSANQRPGFGWSHRDVISFALVSLVFRVVVCCGLRAVMRDAFLLPRIL